MTLRPFLDFGLRAGSNSMVVQYFLVKDDGDALNGDGNDVDALNGVDNDVDALNGGFRDRYTP